MNPRSFPLSGCFHIPMMGCAPTREPTLLTRYPRTRGQLRWWSCSPRWRYRIVDRVGALSGTNASKLSMGYTPTSDQFLQVQLKYDYIYGTRYSFDGFLFWIIPSTYQFRMIISPIIPPWTRRYSYAFLTTKTFRYDFKVWICLIYMGQLRLHMLDQWCHEI